MIQYDENLCIGELVLPLPYKI